MTAVADSSPLILFTRAGLLTLLREVFGQVWIPPQAAQEVFRGVPGRPGAAEIAALAGLRGGWLQEQTPGDREAIEALRAVVDLGEAAAIALAAEHQLLLLIDDAAGRRAAQAMGVAVLGSAGALGLAKRRGVLRSIRPALAALLAQGLRLAPRLYLEILGDAGEIPERA